MKINLAAFCDPDGGPMSRAPFVGDSWRYATNCAIIVREPTDESDDLRPFATLVVELVNRTFDPSVCLHPLPPTGASMTCEVGGWKFASRYIDMLRDLPDVRCGVIMGMGMYDGELKPAAILCFVDADGRQGMLMSMSDHDHDPQ